MKLSARTPIDSWTDEQTLHCFRKRPQRCYRTPVRFPASSSVIPTCSGSRCSGIG